MPIQVTCPSCGKSLKAPESLAGKRAKCPSCGNKVPIPGDEPIYDAEPALPPLAPALPSAQIEPDDYRLEDLLDDHSSSRSAPSNPYASPADVNEPRRPCPACGEMIVAGAAKCRFCGEVFDPTLKKQAKKKKKSRTSRWDDSDDDLSTGELVLCIVCPGIGCIMGLLFLVQGKGKGGKTIGLSLCAGFFWNVLSHLIRNM